jgi:ribosomal protein S13
MLLLAKKSFILKRRGKKNRKNSYTKKGVVGVSKSNKSKILLCSYFSKKAMRKKSNNQLSKIFSLRRKIKLLRFVLATSRKDGKLKKHNNLVLFEPLLVLLYSFKFKPKIQILKRIRRRFFKFRLKFKRVKKIRRFIITKFNVKRRVWRSVPKPLAKFNLFLKKVVSRRLRKKIKFNLLFKRYEIGVNLCLKNIFGIDCGMPIKFMVNKQSRIPVFSSEINRFYNYVRISSFRTGQFLKKISRNQKIVATQIWTYKIMRRLNNLPANGQRTQTNAKTVKRFRKNTST